jgi:Tfp pilus assembly protein PilO
MDFSKLNKRDRILIFAGFGIFFLFIVQRFLFSPMFTKAGSLQQQIKLEEADLKASLEMEQQKDLIMDERLKYKDYLFSDKNVSDDEEIATFLREVETMVSASGLSIVSLTPQSQAEKGGAYKKYDAQLRVEGAPEKIYNFIYKIQNSRLLMSLSNITVTPKNPEANLLKLETTISLTVL